MQNEESIKPRPLVAGRRIIYFLIAVVVILITRHSVLDWHRVTGNSMQPTLQPGNWRWCNKLAYGFRAPFGIGYLTRWAEPQPGEIVILTLPTNGQHCIKRVATPPADQIPPGLGYVWVLGDNGEHSLDSRQVGFVSDKLIEGRVAGNEER